MIIFVKTFFCVCGYTGHRYVFLKEHGVAFHCERAVIQPQHWQSILDFALEV